MTVVVPLDYIHLIYEGFIKHQGWKFIYKFVLSVFLYNKEKLKDMDDNSDVLAFLSSTN